MLNDYGVTCLRSASKSLIWFNKPSHRYGKCSKGWRTANGTQKGSVFQVPLRRPKRWVEVSGCNQNPFWADKNQEKWWRICRKFSLMICPSHWQKLLWLQAGIPSSECPWQTDSTYSQRLGFQQIILGYCQVKCMHCHDVNYIYLFIFVTWRLWTIPCNIT
jgi:hypothetical protein